jgi:hypothetical protein
VIRSVETGAAFQSRQPTLTQFNHFGAVLDDENVLSFGLPSVLVKKLTPSAKPSSLPLLFRSELFPGRVLGGIATAQGLEIWNTESGEIFKRIALESTGPQPAGLAGSGELLFVPRRTLLAAIVGGSGVKKWQAELKSPPASLPVAVLGTVALADASGKLVFFNDENGEVKLSRELPAAPSGDAVALTSGVLLPLKNATVALCAWNEDKTLWTATYSGELLLPAQLISDEKAEHGVVLCTGNQDEYFVSVYKPADGQLYFRAQLNACPVATASDGKLLFVSTEDGDISVYELAE